MGFLFGKYAKANRCLQFHFFLKEMKEEKNVKTMKLELNKKFIFVVF
jgi:hypothetical protein